jgi:hypothetical protein
LPNITFYGILINNMNVLRYSAVKEFGIPLDDLRGPSHPTEVATLLSSVYSIEGKEVSTELTDITPDYWDDPDFRYYLSREREDGPVVVDVMPRFHNSSAFVAIGMDRERLIVAQTPERTVEIPTQQPAMGILGVSPRLAGQICLHELIVHIP